MTYLGLAGQGIALDSIAGRPVHDAPTATLTAPTGTVSSGGPSFTTSWTYAQAQGVAQAKYRLVFTDAAEVVTYWDSGWVSSSATSASVDAVARGIPTDTSAGAIGVRVYVRSADGDTFEGNTGLQTFAIQWGVVTCTVTAPTGSITTTSTTATWTFSSTRGFAEGSWRLRVLYPGSGAVLLDTGYVSGTAVSYAIPLTLSAGSGYRVEVTARNTMGVASAASTSDFTVDSSTASAFTALDSVGEIYEVGINGVGYMLYDNRDQEQFKYQRATVPLEGERLVTSQTPLSESIQRYLFSSAADFKGGAGQLFQDREGAAGDAFHDSDGVDPFNRSKLTLLNSVSREFSSAHSGIRMAVANDVLYTVIGAHQLRARSTPGGGNTDFNIALAGTISDLKSDGSLWYACDGTAIWRNSSAADPGAAWSAIDAVSLGWGAGRLLASYAGAGSSTPNVFTTLTDAGAEEVASGRLSLPAGWSIGKFTAGSGNVFFGAWSGDQGAVYAWDTSASSPHVAWQLPKGEIPVALQYSQGNVIILAKKTMGSVSRLNVYRGEIQFSYSGNASIVPALIATVGQDESPLAHDYGAVGAAAAIGRQVLFSWPYVGGSSSSGLGCVDLSTSGYARWFRASVGGNVSSIVIWQGRAVFSVVGDGVWTQSLTSFVTSGYVNTSIIDGNSNLDKVIDQVSLVAFPLGVSESIQVGLSIDGGNSYTALSAATLSGLGAKRKTTDVDFRSQNVALQVTLNGPGSSTPTLYQASVRYHALGLADTILVLPVDCGDEVGGLNARPLRENAPGAGAARARSLEALVQTQAQVQDVDWTSGQPMEAYEVLQVEVSKVSVYDRNKGKNMLRMVAVVTLRKRER